jgi:hypothetical protein
MGDRPEPIGEVVDAGQHRDDPWRRQRRGLVDRADPRMGVRRANEDGVRQAHRRQVVDETAAPG